MTPASGRTPINPLYLLVLLVLLSSTGFMAARFSVLLYAVRMPSSPATVGVLGAMFSLVSAFASVPTGRLIDRGGVKRPLLYSTAVLGVVVASGAVWRELPVLFAIAVVAGLAHNTMVLAFQRLAGELGTASERPAAFGLLGLGFSFSNLAAPVTAGLAIDHAGFTATFLLFGLLPLMAFAFVWTDRLPWPHSISGRNSEHSEPGDAMPRTGTLGLLRAPRLGRLYLTCGMFECAWMGFGFMVPIHGTHLGFSASRIGMLAGTAGIMLVISRLFMPQLLRRLTPWQLLIAGMVLVGAGFVGFALVTQFAWLAASAMLIGLGQGVAGPMLNALIYEFSPAGEIGEALGLRTLINNVSQAGVPLVTGAVGAILGLAPMFWALGAGLFAIAWSSRAEWRRSRSSGDVTR